MNWPRSSTGCRSGITLQRVVRRTIKCTIHLFPEVFERLGVRCDRVQDFLFESTVLSRRLSNTNFILQMLVSGLGDSHREPSPSMCSLQTEKDPQQAHEPDSNAKKHTWHRAAAREEQNQCHQCPETCTGNNVPQVKTDEARDRHTLYTNVAHGSRPNGLDYLRFPFASQRFHRNFQRHPGFPRTGLSK